MSILNNKILNGRKYNKRLSRALIIKMDRTGNNARSSIFKISISEPEKSTTMDVKTLMMMLHEEAGKCRYF